MAYDEKSILNRLFNTEMNPSWREVRVFLSLFEEMKKIEQEKKEKERLAMADREPTGEGIEECSP